MTMPPVGRACFRGL